MDFAALDLPEPVMRGIREAGFVTATPIQEGVLPLALRGKDVAGQSQTGTGKTAAFLIAAFTRLLRSPAPQAPGGTGAPRVLIIAPTRELVVQIESDLFSATLSFRVLELTWEFMNNPTQITIMPQQKTVERVEQMLFHVGREEKFPVLLGFLKREGGDRILIFTNTREEARRLEDRLTRNRYDTRALTGDVDQKRRLKILNDFKEGRLPVLVATDVASRGLHIEAVSHVVNWDLPQDAEDYVHHIGRTARAGAGGKAVSFVDEASALYLEAIEKFIGQKIPVEWADDDLFVSEIKPTAEERRRFAEERRARFEARGGRFGDRGPRDHGRAGPERRRHEAPHHADRPPAAPPQPPSPGGAAGQGRRRRRRGGGGARPGGPSP